ncbi:AMP-binding protein [Achromobacter sp. Marseille-Q0513]|uniref:AMP-binding protein n=1 Tax=Achromobacter sp. Marseille-Q0513 TaxID=2829161 RepID=UPI001B94A712|nr:AMP-binding protein [Achromobacter sp. Marseille-Q0513]MBR8654584.1 AMP-binding protein [Achromobacter sp. Marseille-Q0513]
MRDIRCPIEGVTYHPEDRARRYFASGAWERRTVGDALRATAARCPQRAALITDEGSLSFQELDQRSERLGAALLRLGLRPSDRAIFQMGTTLETAVALLACYKAGIVPVCTLPQHRELEIGQLARQTRARGYFVQADFGSFDLVAFAGAMLATDGTLAHLIVARGDAGAHAAMQALIDAMPLDEATALLARQGPGCEDVLSFQLSGGTTGMPKIIPRFHAEYLGHALACARRYQMEEEERIIWSLPLLHNAAQVYVLIPVVAIGVSAVLMPRVDVPRMLTLIERHRVTRAMSIGPIAPQIMAYDRLADHDLSSLRLFITMSAAERLEAHLRVPCSNLFGITEGLLLGSPASAPAQARHHTQGFSGCPDDELRLLRPGAEEPVAPGEAGELCFRGPATLPGFFDAPQANASAFTSDGFYRSGDMMTARVVDGQTCYAFEGRLRDNINRGGEKIGCEEVEAQVGAHPAIAEARLVAMPDPFYGEKGCLFVILRPGHAAPTVPELAAFLTGRGLAKYKCPERIESIEAFPVTKVGKLDKAALRQTVATMLNQEAEQAREQDDDQH